ncbi:MAG: carbon-nitrogen hydrolase family protein [Brevirhabdus sp.]
MKIALLQLNSSDDPAENLGTVLEMMRDAVGQGARFVLTPEVTNCVSASRGHQGQVLEVEDSDVTLMSLKREARALGVWLLIGSLGVKRRGGDGRFANRSFLINPEGQIAAKYDKIHMFDVAISDSETFYESEAYHPGDTAVVADTPFGGVGLSICYDVRFAYLYRALAKAGASILTVPAAFSPVTGAAHWESLLRARAIETGCFVLAPAQTGTHKATKGKARKTHGHSMVVAPWGEVILDAGVEPGVYVADIDMADVREARRRVPALTHDREFDGP